MTADVTWPRTRRCGWCWRTTSTKTHVGCDSSAARTASRGSHAGWPGTTNQPVTFRRRALIAVARAREVGVDIEVHRPGVDIHALGQHVLSPAEQCAFAAVPSADRRAAFFRAWARKESFVKAIGEGLACPLASFDVSLDEHVGSALLASGTCQRRPRSWTTIPLDVGAGAAAALTARGALSLRRRAASVWTFA